MGGETGFQVVFLEVSLVCTAFPRTSFISRVLWFSSSHGVWRSYQVVCPCWPQWEPLNDFSRNISRQRCAYGTRSRLLLPLRSSSISLHLLSCHVYLCQIVLFLFCCPSFAVFPVFCFGAWIPSESEKPSVLHRTTTYQRHSRQHGGWLRGMSFIVFSFQHFVFCLNIVKGSTTEELRDVLLLLFNPWY